MKLQNKEIINQSVDKVFKLVRDDLTKLIPYLPNIDRITVVERKEENGKLNVTNNWYAKVELPSLLSKLVKPEIFSWKDIAVWDESTKTVSYKMQSFLANDLFDARGTNTFKKIDDNTTELVLDFEITIYPEKVPGIPRLLAGKAKPLIESLIEKMLAPNLTSLGKGINQYFKNN